MDILKILIPLFFIAFSLGEVAKIQFSNSISIGLFDITVVLLSALYLKRIWKGNFFLKVPILVFILASIFSLVINFINYQTNQILIAALYIVRFVAYTGIYFSAVNLSPKGRIYTLNFMMLSGIFIVGIGYLQLLFYPSLKNLYYLGWDEHMYRMFSTFLDPNFAGIIFVLFFVFFYVFRNKLIPKRVVLHSFILIATFGAIILTYSRGALLMFATSVLIYGVLRKNWKAVVALGVAIVTVFLALSPRFYIENTNLLRTSSASQRIESQRTALRIFQKNPLGVGFNTYRYAREKYGDIDKSRFGPSHAGAGVDNSLVLILVTVGLPGIIAYIFLLYKMFRLGFSKIAKNDMALVFVISLGGLLVNSLFINSLLYSFAMAWIFLIAGLMENN